MAVFRPRVDTINVHMDLVRRHPGHIVELFSRTQEERAITNIAFKSIDPDDRIVLHKEVKYIVCEEYLACLFLKQVDKGRFRELQIGI